PGLTPCRPEISSKRLRRLAVLRRPQEDGQAQRPKGGQDLIDREPMLEHCCISAADCDRTARPGEHADPGCHAGHHETCSSWHSTPTTLEKGGGCSRRPLPAKALVSSVGDLRELLGGFVARFNSIQTGAPPTT